MTVSYFAFYIIVAEAFYLCACSLLTGGPNNVTVYISQSTCMNCSVTSEEGVKWYHNGKVICDSLQCFDSYTERFRMETIVSTRSWNLVISSVKAEDAGEYTCEEIDFASYYWQSAYLFVLEREEKESTYDGLPYISTATSTKTNVTAVGGIIAAAVICSVVILATIFIIGCLLKRQRGRKRKQPAKKQADEEELQLLGDKTYFDQPILEKTIKTRVAQEKNASIRAVAVFKKEVFVVTDNSSEIEVYDAVNLTLKRNFKIDVLNPLDIKPCLLNNCLYIIDCVYVGQPGKILRIDREGLALTEWEIEDSGACLSVASNGNLIVGLGTVGKIVEYNSDGTLVREIELFGPRHAILLENGQFVVSQGSSDNDDFHRVIQLRMLDDEFSVKVDDNDERILETYGEERGSNGLMNVPWYMAVDKNGYILVAERENQRVTLLSPTLEFEKVLISEKDGLRRPLNMYLDIPSGRLFVTDFKWEGAKRVDGQLLVFQIRKPGNVRE